MVGEIRDNAQLDECQCFGGCFEVTRWCPATTARSVRPSRGSWRARPQPDLRFDDPFGRKPDALQPPSPMTVMTRSPSESRRKEPVTMLSMWASRWSSSSRDPELQASQPQSGNQLTHSAGSPDADYQPGVVDVADLAVGNDKLQRANGDRDGALGAGDHRQSLRRPGHRGVRFDDGEAGVDEGDEPGVRSGAKDPPPRRVGETRVCPRQAPTPGRDEDRAMVPSRGWSAGRRPRPQPEAPGTRSLPDDASQAIRPRRRF